MEGDKTYETKYFRSKEIKEICNKETNPNTIPYKNILPPQNLERFRRNIENKKRKTMPKILCLLLTERYMEGENA